MVFDALAAEPVEAASLEPVVELLGLDVVLLEPGAGAGAALAI
jgi:hypothetical protein